MKTALGFSAWLFHDKLGILDELTASRLPTAVLHGVLVLLVYGMTLAIWGFAEAIVAALLILFLPRLLFHAGLACFDAPITALWFATVYAYWKCLDGRAWPWQAGVVFGLALATTVTVLVNQRDVGIARDETVYMQAGPRYFAWWKSLVTIDDKRPSIENVFGGAPGGGTNA